MISPRSGLDRAGCRPVSPELRAILPRRPARRCRGHGRRSRQPRRQRRSKAPRITGKPRVRCLGRPMRRRPRRGPTTTNNAINESAPETGALPSIEPKGLRSLGFDHLRLAVADRDLARLLRLGNLTHEVDVQESVLEARALDMDVVGEL